MGGLASRMRRSPARERRLLLLGLDAAGKSTVLAAVDPKAPAIAPAATPPGAAGAGGGGAAASGAAGRAPPPGAAPAPPPTTTFVVKSFDHGGLHFHLWDVGGAERLRPYWRHYYTGTQGVVYVVDAADRERVDVAAAELTALASDDQLLVRMRCDSLGITAAAPLAALAGGARPAPRARARWYPQPAPCDPPRTVATASSRASPSWCWPTRLMWQAPSRWTS